MDPAREQPAKRQNPNKELSNSDQSFGFLRKVPKEGIRITTEGIEFLGIELQRGPGGDFVPPREQFQDDVITGYDLELMQKIALAFELNEPLLIEGGSGIGKTQTIERMGSLLNWDCYYANCHDFDFDTLIGRKTPTEETKSGFGWRDGIVTEALRGEGPRILVLDEYNFMKGDVRGGLHEILDSVLRGKETVVLLENESERITVKPGLHIVALQNEPGKGFDNREVLDQAQLTRFMYVKEPAQLPERFMEQRALGKVGKLEKADVDLEKFCKMSQDLSRADLAAIPGIQEVVKLYVEFAQVVENAVDNREIGADQSQTVHFSFQRDLNRYLKFVARHYKGDINETSQKAIDYLFVNRFESVADREKMRELGRHVGYFPVKDSDRKQLEDLEERPREKIQNKSARPKNLDEYIRDYLQNGASASAVATALAGKSMPRAWQLRNELADMGADRDKLAESLVNLSCEQSMSFRRQLLKQGAEPNKVMKSLRGYRYRRRLAFEGTAETGRRL